MVDLKRVYRADTLAEAESAMDELEQKWGDAYPIVIKSWWGKWELLTAYFKYPKQIRKVMYTTNSIEAVHRQFRKLTKTKGGFPNDDSLLKLLYMGIENASKKWTMPIQNWAQTLSHLSIRFKDESILCWSYSKPYSDSGIVTAADLDRTLRQQYSVWISSQQAKRVSFYTMTQNSERPRISNSFGFT